MSGPIKLLGVWEAAVFLGVTKQGFAYRRRTDAEFPDPVASLRSGPVWTEDQLRDYQQIKVGKVGRLNVADARRALELGRNTFSFYAEQHRGKLTDEALSPQKIEQTLEKARTNEGLAKVFDQVLRGEEVKWPTNT